MSDLKRAIVRSAQAVDEILADICGDLESGLLPQRARLIEGLSLSQSVTDRVVAYVGELPDNRRAQGLVANLAVSLSQLEYALIDLRRAVAWSARFSGFSWWVENRQRELGLEDRVILPAPGSAHDFETERESSVASCLKAVWKAIGPAESDGSDFWEDSTVLSQLRVLTVPQSDGASPIWHPISLGHELAHLLFGYAFVDQWLKPLRDGSDTASLMKSAGLSAHDFANEIGYRLLRSWLVETACDTCLHFTYGDYGLVALETHLSANSPPDDQPEHPSPDLRLDVLRANSVENLDRYRSGPSEGKMEQWKDAFCALAVPFRDHVKEWLRAKPAGRVRYPAIEKKVFREAQASLRDRRPPSSADWANNVVELAPSIIERNLIAAYWAVATEPATEDPGPGVEPMDPGMRLVEWNRTVEHAVDFLQFAHRFARAQTNESRKLGDAGESMKIVATPRNVLWVSRGGVTDALPRRRRARTGVPAQDLRLGRYFVVFQRNRIRGLDSLDGIKSAHSIQADVEIGWGDQFVLHPGELVLAVTLEPLIVDLDCVAQVLSRSSLGRMGLLSATAVHIQPGYRGFLTLELANLASVPLFLTPGQRIAQLVPFAACGTGEPYEGKYGNYQYRPQFSAVGADKENAILRNL
jgi:deoxycytidine triphosphate deaminase